MEWWYRPIARTCAAVLTLALAGGLSMGLGVAQTDQPPDSDPPPEATPTPEPGPPPDPAPPSTAPDPTPPSTVGPGAPSETPPTTAPETPSTSEPDQGPEPSADVGVAGVFIGSVSTMSPAQRTAVEAFLAATGELARARSALVASQASLAAVRAQADAAASRPQSAARRVADTVAASTAEGASRLILAFDPAARTRLTDRSRFGPVADEATAQAEVERAQAAVDAAEDDLRRATATLAAVANRDPVIEALLTERPPPGDSIAAIITAAQAGQGNPTTLAGLLAWPTPEAPIQSRYGYRIDPITGDIRFHTGVDLGARSGTPVVAAAAGTVLVAGDEDGYGNAVVLDHGDSVATLSGHLSSITVVPGQPVEAGDVIGFVGSSGRSTGPHLHFEVRIRGVAVDPLLVLLG